jgi:carboxyl-terminal processing protease
MPKTKNLLFATICLAFGWAAGAWSTQSAIAQPMYAQLSIFAEVLGHVQNRYVEEISEETLIGAAIDGMLDELDPHSVYMDEEEYLAMQNDTRGEYVGVGIVIREADGWVLVQEVFDGGPALAAGVEPGDTIVSVSGESAEGFGTEDVVERLRGRRGEAVDVVVRRGESTPEEISLTIVRDVIHVDAISESMPVPGYGVVQMRQFQEGVSDGVREAIDRLQGEHGAELEGVILDLRGNPGGLLSEAVEVSDAFLSSGDIVSTGGRSAPDSRFSASRGSTRFDGPLVVLMDEGSASASEIVAGALQDNGRAIILGTQSYGKGSVQSVIDLSAGGGLKLTISRYYTPSGRSIQGEGIFPDIVVEAGVVGPLAPTLSPLDLSAVEDSQIRAALEYLSTVGVGVQAAQ